jgi:predicted GNAT family acetyltransferase
MPRAVLLTRPLSCDDAGARCLAAAADAHGIYVLNALARDEGEGSVLIQDGRDVGLVWFGPRGNLVLIAPPELEPEAVADVVHRAARPWRIAMGPAGIVDALRERRAGKPLLHRDQVYYTCTPQQAKAEFVTAAVRTAQRADRDRLVQATLLLNQSDLNIDPARVDRRWLRDSVDERINDGSTRVLGPLGSPDCKLDFGSEGPAGTVIEGVFTFPAARGRGLATQLVASCIAAADTARVCLHVGLHNDPARCAYERAGMVAVDKCRLLLLG